MHVSIASFIPCVYWCLDYFSCYECLSVTSAGMFRIEIITWMYCWLVFCCHFFQFSTLAIACLFAFVTPAGVFLERAIFTCIYSFSTFPTAFLYVYYFGMRDFRTNHTCIYPSPTQFPHRVARLYVFIVLACVFLERAIHAFFPFLFNFSNRYFGSRHVFRTSHTCVLYTFIISARVLNKSCGLTRPGTSLMICSFTA